MKSPNGQVCGSSFLAWSFYVRSAARGTRLGFLNAYRKVMPEQHLLPASQTKFQPNLRMPMKGLTCNPNASRMIAFLKGIEWRVATKPLMDGNLPWFWRTVMAVIFLAATCSASADLIHRYSFTSNANDSIDTAHGQAVSTSANLRWWTGDFEWSWRVH